MILKKPTAANIRKILENLKKFSKLAPRDLPKYKEKKCQDSKTKNLLEMITREAP